MWWLAAQAFRITAQEIGLPATTKTVSQGFSAILAAVMGVVGGLALIFMIVGALQVVLSAGDPKRFQQGRDTLLYASIGVVVAVGGYALVVFIANATSAAP